MTYDEASQLNEDGARDYLESIRWPDGPVCPKCGEVDNAALLQGKASRPGLLQCRGCRKQFSVTVGTIMERSHIPLRKWVLAFHKMCASKKGVSALQLQRELDLGSYKSAWHMCHRIRLAMREEPLRSLLGHVEADETWIGSRTRGKSGVTDKTPVLALVERGGRARAYRLDSVTAANLKEALHRDVDPDAVLHTDERNTYKSIGKRFAAHHSVNHSKGEYARGIAHINTAESYFALLKRGIHGAFHHVSKRHLPRYLDEFSFRWSHKDVDDGERTSRAIKAAEGKRLTYRKPSSVE